VNEIEVLSIGTPVTIDGDLPATIRRIEIRGVEHNLISYECVWWDGRNRKAAWLERDEFTSEPTIPVNVSFKRGVSNA